MGMIDVGEARFDSDSRVLRRLSGEEHTLRPQAAQVLVELARSSGKVVSKRDLMDAIWGDIAVTESSLTQCVADIRRALGDDDRRILQTHPKSGYRLVVPGGIAAAHEAAPVEPLDDEPIRFATSADGVRLAWTASGSGPPMLKAPSWISNIEMEAQSLIFSRFYRWLGERVRLIRFDQRGTSMSDRVEGVLSIDDMVEDMRAVADAAGVERFFLFGPSQGAAFAIAFARKYPERVIGIVGRGGFGRGWLVSGDEAEVRKYEGSKALILAGWNDPNPEYRRFFTARLIPDCGAAAAREFDEMQRRACDAAAILANLELMVGIDIEDLAGTVATPALLLHSRGDRSVAAEEGRRLAALMPNAEFVLLDDDNHIFLPGTAGFDQATRAIDRFLHRIGPAVLN
ncbi:alpha/beta fold hydrolase [Paracoccus marinaquae]|uniref:Alpha/beta hydrolase n=1 Tax=Paracoccus marinaquae TaxID=2841926 RepID=A0ABS6AD63_9RHOB|nr:alpha/beta fold hydrolase [Paracoccus marinaquae]MBU3028538.1 alpha/beta hydrolase [Paracoccus marinaquae]